MTGAVAGDAEVFAAGGLVTRDRDGRLEVLAVHRPGHDDWSLPKGKLDAGESFEQAALREVEEETGVRCELGPELASSTYRDRRGRSKLVRYWSMHPVTGRASDRAPDNEIDGVRWLLADEALERLTYAHDRRLVAEAIRSEGLR